MAVTGITNALATVAAPSNPPAVATNPSDKLANEQTFLKLLVAQMQNQDPMNPADSTQFMTQLAQFSSLEQLMSINKGITTLNGTLSAATGTPTPTVPGQ